MSGITPIIDTLLHQVLGRRDLPVERPLPEQLINPAQAGRAAQKAYSDSRLDPRPLRTSDTRIGIPAKTVQADKTTPRPQAEQTQIRNPAVATRFSTAARAIAEVLARFPAPPSALRPAAPLLTAGEPIDVAKLAVLLRASIETSGLFYEAHLGRWRSGTLTLEQLALEPQARAQASSTTTAAGTTPSPGTPQSAALASNTQLAAETAAATAIVRDNRTGTTHAQLDSLLRHQLEMLAAPVLRWEGMPWPNVSMAMLLQPPPYDREADDAPAQKRRGTTDDDTWQSQLTLHLARIGELQVNLALGTQRVALDIQAAEPAVARLQAGSDALQARLGALGFEQVALRIRARSDAANHDG